MKERASRAFRYTAAKHGTRIDATSPSSSPLRRREASLRDVSLLLAIVAGLAAACGESSDSSIDDGDAALRKCIDDGNPCTSDVRVQNRCEHPALADGTACPQGTCQSGTCVPSTSAGGDAGTGTDAGTSSGDAGQVVGGDGGVGADAGGDGGAVSPPPSGWPDATNTGYKNAPGYPGKLNDCGTTIESNHRYEFCDFAGTLTVGDAPWVTNAKSATNVTFYGCRFHTKGGGDPLVVLYADGVTFDYSSFEPEATAPPVANADGYEYGIEADGGWYSYVGSLTVTHSDIWGFAHAIDVGGSTQAKPHVYRDNWIHDARDPGTGDHTDGIGPTGTTGASAYDVIDHNTITSVANTGAITYQGCPVTYDHIQITNNLFSGWNDAIQVSVCGDTSSSTTNITFAGNVFSTLVQHDNNVVYPTDPKNFWETPGSVWKCNKWKVPPNASWGDPAHDGLFWVPCPSCNGVDDTPMVSTTDYLGNTTCP